MNNLKRVLSLALASVMLIGMMVVGAGATDFTDADEIQHQEAVDVLVALDVVNGKEDGSYFDPTGDVTRGEMAKMIAVAMKGGNDVSTGTKGVPSFTDIGGHWAESYIEYCYDLGIISGRGDGTFDPNGLVTGTEVTKMVLSALGYDADAYGLVGASWATRTDELARKASPSLYEDLSGIVLATPASRDTAAQIIWNGLQNETMAYSPSKSTSTGEITWDYSGTGNSLLGERYDGQIWYGYYVGNKDTGAANNEGEINIRGGLASNYTGVTNTSFPSDMDISNIGERVKVIWKDRTGGIADRPDNKDVIYGVFNTGETEVYTLTKNDIQDAGTTNVGNNKIKFNDNVYDLAGATINVINNYITGTVTTIGAAGINNNATGWRVQSADQIKFVCDDDGKIATAYVNAVNVARVTSVTSSKVTLSSVGAINIADNDIYEGVAKDDVVLYTKFYDTDKDDAFFTVTKAETVTGKLTGYKGTTGNYTNVVVDGTTYKVNAKALADVTDDAVTNIEGGTQAKIDDAVTLYTNGTLAFAMNADETSGGSYAIITDADVGLATDVRITSTINPAKISILMADGTEATYGVHKDSTYNGTAAITDVAGAGSKITNLAVGNVIEYSMKDGKVKVKNVSIPAALTGTGTGAADVWNKDTKQFTYTAATAKVAASNAIAFVVVDQTGTGAGTLGSEDKFYAYNMRDLATINNTTAGVSVAYFLNDDGDMVKVGSAFVASKPNTSSANTIYGIVSGTNGVRKIGDTEYNSYTIKGVDGSVTAYCDGFTLTERTIVKFDQTTDDCYDAAGDFEVLMNATTTNTTTGNAKYNATAGKDTWTLGAVNSYASNTLSYFTGTNQPTVTADFVGAGANSITVDKDVEIYYFDLDGKKVGDDIGVSSFDKTTGYPNVLFHTDSTDGIIDVIIVETQGDYNMENMAKTAGTVFGTTTTVTLTNSNATIAASAGNSGAYTVALSTTTPAVGATFTVTVTCTSVDTANASGETVSVTYGGSTQTHTFTTAGSYDFTFTAAATGAVGTTVAAA